MINREEAKKLYRELHKDKQAEQDQMLDQIGALIKEAIKEGKESITITFNLSDYVKNAILNAGFATRHTKQSTEIGYTIASTSIYGWAY